MGEHSPSDDKGPTLLVLTCILTSLAVVTTGLRCWTRWGNRQLGFDDGAMAVTTTLAVARMSIQIVSVRYGNGKHREFVSDNDYQTINMLTWYTQVLLFPTICLMKVSICILILRIKDTRPLRYTLGAIITGLVLTNFECLVVLLADCSPLRAYWNGTYADHCWPAEVRIYSIYLQASYAVVTDVICTVLPIYVVWNVRIPWSTKAAVCGLMSMGLVATICSAIRAASLGTTTDDLSYAYCIAAIWANTELFLGIIAANLALSRSIYKYFTERAKTLTSNASGSRTTNLRNSFATPTRMGYIKSPEPSLAFDMGGSPRSEASGIPLRPYKNGSTFTELDSLEKELR
ncbi:hypothetical protein D6D20_09836 [Aureobasidium pullulans]|uniref:Rhodopsin domain-containing protein n=1 Tax=Aureobasidium pullulans TaxID=5580 RepID=A0A4S8YKC1_AURPU|nr:hypothetical protein D6D20_09836 [Aureobasidium pullulans]